jgi:tetratricopeptide (TPR) repeat protein
LRWLYTALRDLDARIASGQAQWTTQQLRDEYRAAYLALLNAPAHTPAQLAELHWRYPACLDLDERLKAGLGGQPLIELRETYLAQYNSERRAPMSSSVAVPALGQPGTATVHAAANQPVSAPLEPMAPSPSLPRRRRESAYIDAADVSDTEMSGLSTTIRFFLSSTFADFQVERDVLQRRVFPELRQLCAASGYRLQPIDLRWGVSEAAGADRQTLRICFDELQRCHRLSPDFFMLIQLGQRYGSYILPPAVPAALVTQLLAHCSAEEQAHFASAYRLDENAVPAEYVLLRAEGPEQDEDEALRATLAQAGRIAGVSEEERLLFEGSATHREIQLGLLGQSTGNGREAGVLCAVRSFTSEPLGSAAAIYAEQDADRAAQVQRLTEAALARLPADQTLRYAVAWPDGQGPAFDEDGLASAYLRLLRPKLEATIAMRTTARQAATAQGQDESALANARFEADRAAQVEGRAPELAQIAAYLAGETGAGLPLVVTGVAGSGKSTLLAEAAKRAHMAHPDATLVVRYIGVTPNTGSLAELLNDIRAALARANGWEDEPSLDDLDFVCARLAAELAAPEQAERPLLLIIDALDQLSDAVVRTDWLTTQLAPNVRVVVSMLEDRQEAQILRARAPGGPFVDVAPLGVEAGRTMLRNLLAAAPARRLTAAQEDALVTAFAVHGLPLYLRLVAADARGWRSFDLPQIGDVPAPASVSGVLDAILARLEAPGRHGRMLVARALGNLASAVYGLAEDETLDVLARDAEVRAAQQALSPSSPPIDARLPLPVALWARLYADIEALLGEREIDAVRLTTFYHNQLRAAVNERYLQGAAASDRHRALADYFASAPWQTGSGAWNWRKARELVRQQEQAGEWKAGDESLAGLADILEREWMTQKTAARESQLEAAAVDELLALIVVVQERLIVGGHAQLGLRIFALLLEIQQARGDLAGAARTLINLGSWANELGQPDEARIYFQQALTANRDIGDREVEGRALDSLGNLALRAGRPEEATGYFRKALADLRAAGDRGAEGRTLSNLGVLSARLGRRDEARAYYEEALALARATGDRPAEGTILGNLGELAALQGRNEEAEGHYQRALTIAQAMGDRHGEGEALRNLGALALRQGRNNEAQAYFQQVLASARIGSDRPAEASALRGYAELAYAQGRFDEALAYWQQALAIDRSSGERGAEARVLGDMGAAYVELGRLDEAAHSFQQSLALSRAVGDRPSEANALNNLGALADRQGQPAEARGYLEQALTIVRSIGDRVMEGTILCSLGVVAESQALRDEARGHYEQALAIAQEVGDQILEKQARSSLDELSSEAQSAINRGWSALREERYEEAAMCFQQAIDLAHAAGDLREEADAYNALGRWFDAFSEPRQARKHFERALGIYRDLGDRAGEAGSLGYLGALAADRGRGGDARKYYEQALAIHESLRATEQVQEMRDKLTELERTR